MTFEPDDLVRREPIGLRRYAAGVDLPLDARMRTRLGRALTNALVSPVRGIPTARRAIRQVRQSLHAQGYSNERVRLELERLIEEIALRKGLDATSLVSGRSRRHDLVARLTAWFTNAGDEDG